MSLQAESASAVEVLERVQDRLREEDGGRPDEELASLIHMLQSPLFTHLLQIEDSLTQLKEFHEHRPLGPDDFDIDAQTGVLSVSQQEELTSAQVQEAYTSQEKSNSEAEANSNDLDPGLSQAALEKALIEAAWGREMHSIELYKPENSSLGFSVVGLRSEARGELGIFVQEVQPGGIAHKDGRLAKNDQILAINTHVLDASISHQQAIRILQQTRGTVQLVVARGTAASPTTSPTGTTRSVQSAGGQSAGGQSSSSQHQHSPRASPSPPSPRHDIAPPPTNPPPPLPHTAAVVAAAAAGTKPEQQSNEEEEEEDSEAAADKVAELGGAPSTEKQQLNNEEHNSLDRTPSALSETNSDMVLSTEWSQLEVIDLLNDGTGLGFGIIGGKSTGVVVKTILPGGVADRDGRLRSGDHIMQIGDVNVRGMGSDQVASVLRQSGAHVRLIVARAVQDSAANMEDQLPHAPLVPTHELDEHLQDLNQALLAIESQEALDQLTTQQYLQQYHQLHGELPQGFEDHGLYLMDMGSGSGPEVEYFGVDLPKGSQGLGITIAGYAGAQNPEDLSGIFVRSITEGSATAVDGRVQVNDQIIEVDGQSLEGFTNHQAVEVLRQTGQVVRLKLARYRHGRKYLQLQQYASQALKTTSPVSTSREDLQLLQQSRDTQQQQQPLINLEDITLNQEDFSTELPPEVEEKLLRHWQPIVGDNFTVVVAQLSKFSESGGLGISLEGTVDVEDGVEVRPHHYIRSVLNDGPVGINGKLASGDELLEVNSKRLLGLNHMEVVSILKELPQHVRLVCARKIDDNSDQPTTSPAPSPDTSLTFNTTSSSPPGGPRAASPGDPLMQFHTPPVGYGGSQAGSADEAEDDTMNDRLFKAKSEQVLPVSGMETQELNRGKSRSMEPMNNLAMWSSEPLVIELLKGDKGLGFSILDYQDPIKPDETVIVIRSLVPGGVAQQDGRLVPGDRLVFVNDVNLENATLDQAVAALKGAQPGMVRVGVAKPMQLPDIGESSTDPPDFDAQFSMQGEDPVSTNPFQTTADIPPPTLPPPIPSDSPPTTPPPPPPPGGPGDAVDGGGLAGLMLSELSLPSLDNEPVQQTPVQAQVPPEFASPPASKPEIASRGMTGSQQTPPKVQAVLPMPQNVQGFGGNDRGNNEGQLIGSSPSQQQTGAMSQWTNQNASSEPPKLSSFKPAAPPRTSSTKPVVTSPKPVLSAVRPITSPVGLSKPMIAPKPNGEQGALSQVKHS